MNFGNLIREVWMATLRQQRAAMKNIRKAQTAKRPGKRAYPASRNLKKENIDGKM